MKYLINASTAINQDHFVLVAQLIQGIFQSKFLSEHGKNYLKLTSELATEYTKFVIAAQRPNFGVPFILNAVKNLVEKE